MIEGLPQWITILFLFTCLVTIVLFHYSNGRRKGLTLAIISWAVIQSVLAYTGFYQDTIATPPRFALVLLPSILIIIYSLLPKQRERILSVRDTRISTFLHSVRLLVEIVLFGLFTDNMIPKLMTFEGRNYDILIGISALIVGVLFLRGLIGKSVLLYWNYIGLLFVLFIFINGILSSPLPIQLFGFAQPNRAIMYFPFVLLPAMVVPIVIWTHLSDIIKLNREINEVVV